MKRIIISLGGSLIVPDEIDVIFLKKFKKLIDDMGGCQFVIYCGGGSIARKYQKAYSKIVDDDPKSLDWIGISATHLNAFLLKTIFYDISEKEIITDPTKQFKFTNKVAIAGGWKPGWSTDYDAVLLAKNLKVDMVINMTNTDYAYDKDPARYDDAKPIDNITWEKFRELVGKLWKPGLNMPFDPIASKEAEKIGLKVVIIGKDLNNLKNLIEKKKFAGTVIQ
ncbi:MAG: UMP kinase [Nanoarchaeota archaeon]